VYEVGGRSTAVSFDMYQMNVSFFLSYTIKHNVGKKKQHKLKKKEEEEEKKRRRRRKKRGRIIIHE